MATLRYYWAETSGIELYIIITTTKKISCRGFWRIVCTSRNCGRPFAILDYILYIHMLPFLSNNFNAFLICSWSSLLSLPIRLAVNLIWLPYILNLLICSFYLYNQKFTDKNDIASKRPLPSALRIKIKILITQKRQKKNLNELAALQMNWTTHSALCCNCWRVSYLHLIRLSNFGSLSIKELMVWISPFMIGTRIENIFKAVFLKQLNSNHWCQGFEKFINYILSFWNIDTFPLWFYIHLIRTLAVFRKWI